MARKENEMTKAKYTPEPWTTTGERILGPGERPGHVEDVLVTPFVLDDRPDARRERIRANAARACECVNAFAAGGPVARLAEAASLLGGVADGCEGCPDEMDLQPRVSLGELRKLAAALAAVRELLPK
jgi:hypothetical protein